MAAKPRNQVPPERSMTIVGGGVAHRPQKHRLVAQVTPPRQSLGQGD